MHCNSTINRVNTNEYSKTPWSICTKELVIIRLNIGNERKPKCKQWFKVVPSMWSQTNNKMVLVFARTVSWQLF